MKKVRLDKALVDRDVARSRSQAKRLIESDEVLVNGFPVSKPASMVDAEDTISLMNPEKADWVGRGGRKIKPYLDGNIFSVNQKICLDVGSSTGGFTQALLKSGASHIYAVDAGEGQLAYELRNDDRVTVREQYNFRYADREDFVPEPDRFVMDVSFISTLKLTDAVNEVLSLEDSEGFVLIKPQFEADQQENTDGVVRDPDVVISVITELVEGWAEAGWGACELVPAALQGASGNREFFMKVRRNKSIDLLENNVEKTVYSSFDHQTGTTRSSN